MPQSILVVDRDSEWLDVASRFLDQCGYDVVTACDGLECVGKWRDLEPDVLILETGILWGGCDGVIDVILESAADSQDESMTESNDKTVKCPVILVTTDEFEHGDHTSNVAAILRKPLELSLLHEHIQRTTNNPMLATEGFLAQADRLLGSMRRNRD